MQDLSTIQVSVSSFYERGVTCLNASPRISRECELIPIQSRICQVSFRLELTRRGVKIFVHADQWSCHSNSSLSREMSGFVLHIETASTYTSRDEILMAPLHDHGVSIFHF